MIDVKRINVALKNYTETTNYLIAKVKVWKADDKKDTPEQFAIEFEGGRTDLRTFNNRQDAQELADKLNELNEAYLTAVEAFTKEEITASL